MLKCPACQSDNQIGAIFCRTCGDKLNLDEIEPDEIINAAPGVTGSSLYFVKKLIMLCIFLCLVGALVSLFLAPGINIPPPLDEKAEKAAAGRFSRLMSGRSKSETFTEAELHYIVNIKLLVLTDEQKTKDKEQLIAEGYPTTLMPDITYLEFPSPGVAKITVKSNLLDKASMYSTVFGSITGGEEGITFNPNKMLAGRLLVPPIGPMQDHLNWRFMALISENDRAQAVKKTIKSAVIETGRITLKR
ncbi:MAG: hypothetical protein ACI8W8_004132 [Rhodothermales bacterium]|jgi:hypothetical protein